jgi:hypothetical protein
MPVSPFVFYFVAEIMVVLLIICLFLLFHVRGLKNLISALEAKILSLRVMIKRTRGEARQAAANLEKIRQQKPKNYLDFLDEQIERTRTHHEKLKPDRDIVLDIDPESPADRQAASLRHAFLIAEQEAMYSGGDDHHPDWNVLEAKFSQLIQFYKDNLSSASIQPVGIEDTTEVDQLRKRIENLEEFKKLYFELEKKWEAVSDNADGYHQQLLAMGQSMGAGEDFENLLDNYAKNFNDFGLNLGDPTQLTVTPKSQYGSVEIDPNKPSVGKMVIANQEEIQRLKNMAVDQHKVIQELKRKLVGASSVEQKDEVIEEMAKQMERQERFLKESETCAKLMEDEMNRMSEENQMLREQLEQSSGSANPEDIQRLENIIADLTDASQEMLSAISTLEQENRELKESGAGSGVDSSAAEVDNLKNKLSQTQQNLLDLQAQHLELEERYLDLKRKQK